MKAIGEQVAFTSAAYPQKQENVLRVYGTLFVGASKRPGLRPLCIDLGYDRENMTSIRRAPILHRRYRYMV
jgi:hypothetical protein